MKMTGSRAGIVMMVRMSGSGMVRVGLLGRTRAGACPNLLQRRSGPGSAARRIAEYQRFSSSAPVRSGPLQQIWTNSAAAGSDGDHSRCPDVHFALESAVPAVVLECKMHHSRAKCTSRRAEDRRSRPGRLFGGRPVVFPGGDIMKAVRGVVLSAFPGCDTRCCQGSWGAGPVVMARPGRLRVRRGESGATGSAGRSSGADRVERGRFRRPAPAPPRLRVPHGGTASRMS